MTKEENLQALISVKLLKRILKEKSVQHSHDEQKSLQEIEQISAVFKNTLDQQSVPTQSDEIIQEAEHLVGKEKMSIRDHIAQKTRFDEGTIQVLKAYKEIEVATKNMQLEPGKAETFNYYKSEVDLTNEGYSSISKKTFQAYPLPQSQKFMIHATHLSNIPALAEKFERRQFSASTMCVSLINATTGFFMDKSDEFGALVLAVDPRQIVLTSPTDIASPTPAVSPNAYKNKLTERRSNAYRFYHTHQSILRLSQRIETIHKASGFVKSKVVEMRDVGKKIENKLYLIERRLKFMEEEMQGDNKIDPRRLQELTQEILEHKALMDQTKLELTEIKNQLDRIDQKDLFMSLDLDYLPLSMRRLIMHYQENPEKNDSPEEFQKIFGYPGQDINRELEKYTSFLNRSGLFGVGDVAKSQRLEFPEDLLALREQFQKYNYFKHTEINVKIDSAHARARSVEGIILRRKTIEAYSRKDPLDSQTQQFFWMIQYAQENDIPILIQEDLHEDLHVQTQPRARL